MSANVCTQKIMHIYIIGNSIETILYLAQKNIKRGQKVAIVANEKKILPFDFSLLEREKVVFYGIDIYLQPKIEIESKYDVIFFYNIYPKTENIKVNDVAIWILDNSIMLYDPFKNYSCQKIMGIQNYTTQPILDASVNAVSGYDEKVYIPYSEKDNFERISLQLLGTWRYENLSKDYRKFLKKCENLICHKQI